MPNVIEAPTTAFISCTDGRCAGYEQAEIPAHLTVVETLYTDSDPNGIPGVEKSQEHVSLVDENGDPMPIPDCDVCGKPSVLSQTPRPEYAKVSGQDPMEIFNLYDRTTGQLREMRRQNAEDDVRRDREMAELRDQIAQLTEALAAQPVKRGPGRPPKAVE